MGRIQIKICGVSNVQDAKFCAELGVDMIGLNFYQRSPRAINLETARRIVEAWPATDKTVAVFVDAGADEIRATAKATGISTIQLHGTARPEICRELAQEFRVIRALQTSNSFRPKTATLF